MLDFFDNRDEYREPGFLRGNTYYIHFLHFYGSFRSFCKQKQHFSPSLALPVPLLVSTSSNLGFQDCAIKCTLLVRAYIEVVFLSTFWYTGGVCGYMVNGDAGVVFVRTLWYRGGICGYFLIQRWHLWVHGEWWYRGGIAMGTTSAAPSFWIKAAPCLYQKLIHPHHFCPFKLLSLLPALNYLMPSCSFKNVSSS